MHFRPARNWMNDPNGLVFHDGRYHLFFQYNPEGATHALMSWGHASSADLVTWDEHPLALRYTDEDEIFSGSVVDDERDTSGLGTDGRAPLVAIYTLESRRRDRQAQGLASSTDGGMTWTPYPGNPVLDRGSADFRDPKVFRYRGDAGQYWVMVVVEAVERRVLLYRSDDLRTWEYLSDYGGRGSTEGVWECPDLFPLAVDGDPGDVRWVLLISVGCGSIAGGSGTQYVLGRFDGIRFTPDEPPAPSAPRAISSRAEQERLDWLDHGRDCYAGVTFSGLPDQERILIAWMSNWDYARVLPVDADVPQRGAMTLARRLSLATVDGRVQLRQQPVGPAVALVAARENVVLDDGAVLSEDLPDRCRIDLRVRLGAADGFALDLGGAAVVEYSVTQGVVRVDRRLGADAMPDPFGSVEQVWIGAGDSVELTIWLGRQSIELFARDGTRTITDLLPERRVRVAALVGRGGSVLIDRFAISALREPVSAGMVAGMKEASG